MKTSARDKFPSIPRSDSISAKRSLIEGIPAALPDRKISERTCRFYDYHVGIYMGGKAEFANYRNRDGLVVAQHVRHKTKAFAWTGDKSSVQLWGQHLGSDGTLILTEGQIDAMTVYECLHKHRNSTKFVVASITDGAASAKNSCTKELSWILGFKRVIIFMDTDEPGTKAAAALAELIGPTAAIAGGFPYKDASEAWVAGDFNSILEAINNAKRHRPEAIVHAPDLLSKILKPENRFGLLYPWQGWNDMTEGMKPGQLIMISGGTGIGKSLFTRSIALHLCKGSLGQDPVNVAYIGLEESCETSLERMLSEELGFNPGFHLDTPEMRGRRDVGEIEAALNGFAPNLFLLNKFGSDDFDSFVATVKHYVLAEQCQVVVLDHFSLLADGIALNTDQRRAIDRCIKDLKTLCIELNFTMLVVCHLSRGGGIGPSHEEGGEPTLAELRGSHSLAQIPDFVVMLVRNPRAEDKVEANTTYAWLKKNRVKGELGLMSKLHYLPSCRFHEIKTN
jgi:twinkle protein